VRTYHRLDVRGTSKSIGELDRPVLFVANHGFGGLVDLNVFATLAALDELNLTRPVTILTHQLAWTLGAGRLVEQVGARRAGWPVATAALARGEHVLVFPGGDIEASKPFARRNDIVLSGRRGFARLAAAAQVAIVPIVTAGAGGSLLVLSDGQWLARTLRTERLARLKALPITLSVPWGLSPGLVGLLPYCPLPVKLTTRVLPSMAPEQTEDYHHFGDRVERAMQHALTKSTHLS
jgi:1-acyl-sn-glycerol-3-phosphate acyltransferase